MPQPTLRLPPLPSIREIIKLYRLRALRQLSQNFLLDQRITDNIVRAAGPIYKHHICEVGPGPGSITRSILKKHPAKLVVVEKDPRVVPTLEQLKESCLNRIPMDIELADIRDYNFDVGFKDAPKCEWLARPPLINLIGNLPFNVSTNLLIRWLKSISEKSSIWSYGRVPMTLTFQKEVAERIVARDSQEQRCRLSVICQLFCEVEHKFTIPGKAFLPKPKVDVGVVTLIPLRYPLVKLPFETVEKVLRTVFNMRQKFCKRSAEMLFPPDIRDDLVFKLFSLAELDMKRRAFELTNEEFVRMCYAYKVICEEFPGVEDYDFRGPKNSSVEYIKDAVESCF